MPPPVSDPPLPVTADGAPDWDLLTTPILCSRCAYNLRGLSEPRCPECGLPFAWRDVLSAGLLRSKFLFEHNWRRRPLGSYLETLLRSLWPARFWSRVSLHDHLTPAPLWFFLISFCVVLVLAREAAEWAWWGGLYWFAWLSDDWGGMGVFAIAAGELSDMQRYRERRVIMRGGELLMLLTAATTATALVGGLRQTLGRCRVRPIQVLRACAYALPPALALVYLSLNVWLRAYMPEPIDFYDRYIPYVFGTVAACIAVVAAYVTLAVRDYLRLPRAGLIATAAGAVGVLSAIAGAYWALMGLAAIR